MRFSCLLHKPLKYIALIVILAGTPVRPAAAQWVPLNPVQSIETHPGGVLVVLKTGFLRYQVCLDSIIHVVYSLERTPAEHPDYLVTKKSWPKTDFAVHTDDAKVITLTTARLKIEITRSDSSAIFYDASGRKLAQENSRTLTPVEVNGQKTLHSERFVNMWDTQEAFYGLGQHQAGVWNYRGEAVDLSQDNTNISIPFLLSSKGYAIFWNNGSRSRFNNRFVHAFYMSSEVADSMDYYFFLWPGF